MNDKQNVTLDDIASKLDYLIALHTPKTRKPRKRSPVVHTDPKDDKKQEMLRIFFDICKLPDLKKAKQHFPVGIYNPCANKLRGNIEIVPRSILVNRASMRSVFRPSPEEYMEKSSADIASETLDELVKDGELVVGSLGDVQMPAVVSKATCVFSPKWADLARLKGHTEREPLPVDGKPRKPKLEPQKDIGDVLRGIGALPPKTTQKPAVGHTVKQETATREEGLDAAKDKAKDKEQELIRQMQEAEKEDLLDDNDEVFEREEKSTKRRIEL